MPKPKPRKGKSGSAKQTRRERKFSPALESRLLAETPFAEDLPFDDEKQRLFLTAYYKTASLARARKATGTTEKQLSQAKKTDPVFAECLRELQEYHLVLLEDSAFLRACNGWDEPVFHNGSQCGTRRKFSNALTIFLLKCRRPDVYNIENRTGQQVPEEVAKTIIELTKASNAQFENPDDDAALGPTAEAAEGP